MSDNMVMEKRGPDNTAFEPNPLIDSLLSGSLGEDCSAIERVLLRTVLRARSNNAPMSILLLSCTDASKQPLSRVQMRKLLVAVGQLVRHTDSSGQLNKQEILIVLPGAEDEGARIAASRVADNGQMRRLVAEGFNIDFAVGELLGDETALETMIERARASEDKLSPKPMKSRRRM